MNTLAPAHDTNLEEKKDVKVTTIQKAQYVGKLIAEIMKKEKIPQVVFDRRAYP